VIEIFKTNIQEGSQCTDLIDMILRHYPSYKINFDLEDCDKILRVEALSINNEDVISFLGESGFDCEVLPD